MQRRRVTRRRKQGAGAEGLQKTPAQLGFRLPAEWESHEATWIGWPHNLTDWPSKFSAIPWVYGEIVRKLAEGEKVRILANSTAHEEKARRVLKLIGADSAAIEFFDFPTNRGWTRDSGPMFLRRDGPNSEVAVIRFRFNAWARYDDWQKDNGVPERVARALRLRLLRAGSKGRELVVEGGSIDVNGHGTLLTTHECLLDPRVQVRNPGLDQDAIEAALRSNLGVKNILWLGKGIAGDDTHGHVDDLCRFVGPRTVVLCQEDDPQEANYEALQENRERLQGMRLEDGSKIDIVPIPMPSPLSFRGQRLPASYANFYISNAAVLVPTFNDKQDRVALGTIGELFPDRPVVGIHSVDLVWGLGTLHCLTHEQPAR
jgi:agmatine deiminase